MLHSMRVSAVDDNFFAFSEMDISSVFTFI